ncbi:MAG: PEP-CTERM sorting domain-containing protein [Bryobacterales bacterium]|nr:PEP-CTERM sorting domain-containing protein [Bryobacterales bacterium]
MTWKLLKLSAATALFAASLPAASLTLTPSTISGAPGSTIGWNFSLNNDTPNWIIINNVAPSGFNPALGAFTEYAASNFNVVAPNTVFAENFNGSLLQGFGQFEIVPGAIIGDFTIGSFVVGYDTYSTDPLLDGGAGFITGTNTFVIESARVNVVDGVPEPATVILTGAALAAVLTLRRRR